MSINTDLKLLEYILDYHELCWSTGIDMWGYVLNEMWIKSIFL